MATLGNQMVDRTKVVAAFRKLKRAPDPSDELIDLIVETANDWSDEPPPFNRFFDDDLRKAYANLYRLLRIHAKFWRNTLKRISRRKPQSAFEEAMLADIMDELKPLISDAEIIMKAPAFYHRMSEANLRGKENPRGETPINRMRRNLVELIRTGGYNQAQARRVALYLFPAINVNDPNEALKPALKPQNERQKGNDSAPDPIATGPGAYQLLCCFRHLGSTITASQQVICADARQTIDEPLDVGATYIQTLSHADPRPQFARLHQSFAC